MSLSLLLAGFSFLPGEGQAEEEGTYDRGQIWAAFAEPVAGATFGFYGNDTTSALGSAQKINSLMLVGPTLGVRGGALYETYFFGLDAEFSMLMNSTLPSSFQDFKVGLIAGGILPTKPFRYWIGIAMIDSLNTGTQTLSSDSFKFGVGYFLTRQISLNLELNLRSYGKVNIDGTSVTPSYTNFLLTVSLPYTMWAPSMTSFSYQRMKDQESQATNGLF